MIDPYKVMYDEGRRQAQGLQERAPEMSGTELNAETDTIPSFQAARIIKNMLYRPASSVNGFICKSTAGRVVRLLQPYDSDIFTAEPEELPAQWGFVWSQDPAHALPFVAISTSPYNKGDCCTESGTVYRSAINNNVWAPSEFPAGWDALMVDFGGLIEEESVCT